MTPTFRDLMTGLDEVDTFLSGERTGYKVTLPVEIDPAHSHRPEDNASQPASVVRRR